MHILKVYICAYNSLQLMLWLYILIQLCATICVNNSWAQISQPKGAVVYQRLAALVDQAQGLAVLEVAHAATGIVRGGPLMAFLQWFGRANVLYAVLKFIPEAQEGWPVTALFFAWSIAEVIRYPWYTLAQFGDPPQVLTWLRYSAFIPLYPIGIASEVAIMLHSLPRIRQENLHSIQLPNRLNFGFSYWAFTLLGLAVLYPTAFPFLFRSLLSQRKKRLNRAEENM